MASCRNQALLGLLVAVVADVASAQAPVFAPAGVRPDSARGEALRHRSVVDGQRLSIVEERAPLGRASVAIGLNTPGPLWTYSDQGEGWIGRAVALGDRGTQVFVEFDTAADRTTLLSGFDVDPVVPVWADPIVASSTNARVQGADGTGRFVSCRQIAPTPNGPRQVVVSAYGSSSSAPQWSWTFPWTTYGSSRAMIRADGGRIVAAMHDPFSSKVHVARFDDGSPVPTRQFSHPVGVQLQALTMSEDGTTLYVATTTTGYLFDLDRGRLVQSIALQQSFAAQDVSGDGSVLAVGYFNGVDVWQRQPAGNYLRVWQGHWPGPIVCHQLDVSEDGSTLVLGFGYHDQDLRVRIEAIDLRTRTATNVDEAQGAGTHQNIVSRIVTSADGRHFAVGLWGDEAGLVPELRVYRRGVSTPAATYDFPGSVYDLAMSRAGDRVVVGVKAAHANVLAGGGAVALFSNRGQDFAARGTPAVGRKVDFDLWGAPGSPARLLVSTAPAANPAPFGSLGTLYLDRTQLVVLPMTATDGAGHATGEFQIAPDPATIGTTLWFQGLTTSPRRLTADHVAVTILP